jgi:hypothetical protein
MCQSPALLNIVLADDDSCTHCVIIYSHGLSRIPRVLLDLDYLGLYSIWMVLNPELVVLSCSL